MCPQCRAFITTDDKVCPYCDAPVGPRAIEIRNPGEALGGLIPQAHFTTVLILLINAGLYVATAVYSMQAGRGGFADLDSQTLFFFGAKMRLAVEGGQWWRLITAGFLHGGIIHIGMNSWVLYDLGAQVEEAYGTARFLVIYFLTSIAGFYLSMLWNPGISVGASAALFGLIGAMIALGTRSKTGYGQAMRSFYVRWAVYGMAMGFLFPAVDNAAHRRPRRRFRARLCGGHAAGHRFGREALEGGGGTQRVGYVLCFCARGAVHAEVRRAGVTALRKGSAVCWKFARAPNKNRRDLHADARSARRAGANPRRRAAALSQLADREGRQRPVPERFHGRVHPLHGRGAPAHRQDLLRGGGGRVPVLAGAAEANVKETLGACETYAGYGARAVAIVSPFYYRLGPESVYALLRRDRPATRPIDVTLYNIPMFASPIDVQHHPAAGRRVSAHRRHQGFLRRRRVHGAA